MTSDKMNNYTFYFKEIYPNIKSITDDATKYGVTFVSQTFANLFAQILLSEYANYETAYDTVEAFKRHFWLTALDEVPRYETQRAFAEVLYNTSVDDVNVKEHTVNIASFNNSSILEEPLDKINPYVDAQNASKTTNNKFDSITKLIQNIPTLWVYEFLEKFRHHFIVVLTHTEYYYRRD